MKKPTNTKKTGKQILPAHSKRGVKITEKKTNEPVVKKPRGWVKGGEKGVEKTEVGSGNLKEGNTTPLSVGVKVGLTSENKEVGSKSPEQTWKDWTQLEKHNFLINNLTDSTPVTQEQLSKKAYPFLPKKVKLELENLRKSSPIVIVAVGKNPILIPVDNTLTTDVPVVPAEMLNYGLCLEKYITESPAVGIHGKFPKNELDDMINTALKKYTYTVEHDEFGGFITMTNETGIKLRIPQNGYLPL